MTDANHIVTHNEWSINRRRRTACLQQEIRGDTCTAPSLAITYRGRRREIGQRNAVHLPHGHLPPYPTLILNPNRLNPNKKLCYCIRIARRAISVEIMSTACCTTVRTLGLSCTTNQEQVGVLDYGRDGRVVNCHDAPTAASVVNKLINRRRVLLTTLSTADGDVFPSPSLGLVLKVS